MQLIQLILSVDCFVLSGMAQRMFQMSILQYDTKYEELQRIRQIAILQCVRLYSLSIQAFRFMVGPGHCPMISKYGPSLSKEIGPVDPSFLFVKKSHLNKIFILQLVSTVILLPSAESFKKGCCQLQAKVCAGSTG